MKKITDYDAFFISFREPNADYNFKQNQRILPNLKRVDNIKGFDAAHKRCAEISSTECFITIDGDNILREGILNAEEDENILRSFVVSYSGYLPLNGLIYGNGGIKVWPVHIAINMDTHESSSEQDNGNVDFCWSIPYHELDTVYSNVYSSETPLQAFRSGFREGVKMTLNGHQRIGIDKIHSLPTDCINRLKIWSSVGLDFNNGLWAIYGARLGCAMNLDHSYNFNITNINDYDWFESFWYNEIAPKFSTIVSSPFAMTCDLSNYTYDSLILKEACNRFDTFLSKTLNLGPVPILSTDTSKWFKSLYTNPSRT